VSSFLIGSDHKQMGYHQPLLVVPRIRSAMWSIVSWSPVHQPRRIVFCGPPAQVNCSVVDNQSMILWRQHNYIAKKSPEKMMKPSHACKKNWFKCKKNWYALKRSAVT
jgi:hypothetical protein